MPPPPARPGKQFTRYVVAGLANTALTYVLLVVLMRAMDYRTAYTIVYVLGIAIAYVLNSRYVFRVSLQARKAVAFPLVYALQWLIGLAWLWFLVDGCGVAKEIAALLVVALNVPLGFLLTRRILA
jgi:putative flippase GtrA